MATTKWDHIPFCPRCKLSGIEKASSSYYYSPVRAFTTYNDPVEGTCRQDSTFHAGCPLCKIFLHFYSTFQSSRTGTSRISLFSLSTDGLLYDDKAMVTEFGQSERTSFLAVLSETENTSSSCLDSTRLVPPTKIGCILKLGCEAITNDRAQFRQTEQNSEIDFTQLRAWMTECCDHHQISCAKPNEPRALSGMRVIDVRSRDIVPATLNFDYAALSYVWGPRSEERAQNGLPNPAPKLIEDALEVTKKLQIPYLWVDRYCIPQHRADEMHDQISKMHLIYNNARITIIVAVGTGPNHGIPGIRETPRVPQPHAILDQDLLVAIFPHPTSVIKKSKWASRGWTYQEAALSRRRLAFTAYGSYFECNSGPMSEGIEEPIRQMMSKSPRGLKPRLCGGISAWSSHSIWQHISEFSKRDLSYQEDRLNAFLGILGALEKSGMLKGHLWGIPIQDFSGSVFTRDLMWGSKGPIRRNFQLPSWSWTGWRGEINNHDPLNKEALLLERLYIKSSRVNVFVELLNGDTVSLESFNAVSEGSIKSELFSKYIHISAPSFKCRFRPQCRYANGFSCRYYWSPIVYTHPGKLGFPSVELSTLWQTEKTNLEKRLAAETWDVIYWRVGWTRVYCLVLYRFNDYVERFGHFWGNFEMFKELNLISEDRIFRLG